jgi:hypothetical protein
MKITPSGLNSVFPPLGKGIVTLGDGDDFSGEIG